MSATRLVVDRKSLLTGLAAVRPALARSAGLAPLRGVRITGTASGAVVEASNLDLTLRAPLEAKLDGPDAFDVVLPARSLRTIVLRGLPDGDVAIGLDRQRVTVSAGRTTAWLDPLPVEEWPRGVEFVGKVETLTAADVATIKRVAVAASSDWARPILHAVCLADGVAVATDSYRLMVGAISATPSTPALLPVEAVKVLPDADTVLVIGDNQVAWGDERSGGRAVLVRGEYPHWQNLMPEQAVAPLILNRAAFLAAVLRAEAVLSAHDDRTGAIPLSLIPVAGGIALGARHVGDDLFDEAVDAGDVAAVEPIAVNARFLAELLRSIDGQRVRLTIRERLKPVLITGDGDDSVRALLMPVRVEQLQARKAS